MNVYVYKPLFIEHLPIFMQLYCYTEVVRFQR